MMVRYLFTALSPLLLKKTHLQAQEPSLAPRSLDARIVKGDTI
jgi:hypothetical protein